MVSSHHYGRGDRIGWAARRGTRRSLGWLCAVCTDRVLERDIDPYISKALLGREPSPRFIVGQALECMKTGVAIRECAECRLVVERTVEVAYTMKTPCPLCGARIFVRHRAGWVRTDPADRPGWPLGWCCRWCCHEIVSGRALAPTG